MHERLVPVYGVYKDFERMAKKVNSLEVASMSATENAFICYLISTIECTIYFTQSEP